MIPSSLPSPPSDWSSFEIPLGFLHDLIPFIPEQLVIHVYALAILLGIAVAIVVSNYRLTARGAEPWIIIDLAIWAVVFGIVGSRVWHVATHPDDFFGPGDNPWDVTRPGSVWAVWEGGVAIFGAVLFGALGVFIACRMAGLRFSAAVDAMAPTLLLAQAFGRLGNYFNQELFGLPTDLPWGLEIDRPNPAIPVGIPEDALFHPTFLYEIIWNLAGAALIILLERRINLRWGKALAVYLIWYGVGRSYFESIRVDPSEMFLGIRANVWASFAAVVLGIVLFIVQTRRHTGEEPSPYVPGREWKGPDAEVDSGDTESDSDSLDDGVEGENLAGKTAATSSSRSTSP